MTWEYLRRNGRELLTAEMNDLGREGWEMVSMSTTNVGGWPIPKTEYHYVFKRERRA
jgi:hypothetical protein